MNYNWSVPLPFFEAENNGSTSDETKRNSKKNCSFEVEDAVLCQDRTSSEWNEASIVGVTSEKEIKFNVRSKRSGQVEDSVELKFLAPGRGVELSAEELEKGMRLLAFMLMPNCHRGWYKVLVTRVEKAANMIPEVFGTVLLALEEKMAEQRVFFAHSTFKFPEMTPREQWTRQGIRITLRKQCERCVENPRFKCRTCSCVFCGVKGGAKPLITCRDCENKCHVSCANAESKNRANEKWLCTRCRIEEEETRAVFADHYPEKKPKITVQPRSAAVVVPENRHGKVPGVTSGQFWVFKKNGVVIEKRLKRKLPVEEVKPKKEMPPYVLPPSIEGLIREDVANDRNWNDLSASLKLGHPYFIAALAKKFRCCVCKKVVKEPITLSCSHNACLLCFEMSSEKARCPCCKEAVEEKEVKVNHLLDQILNTLLPGYNPKKASPKLVEAEEQ
ncbi:E3 ubiquitin-protein ligase UHRF1-like [Cloeon dipterum]|uniref:E3 ubiquitin-protein ligase UHRF1-like n=1 Tax=Cloeon dipterum TaxID=197152 RepID=UPI00322091EB